MESTVISSEACNMTTSESGRIVVRTPPELRVHPALEEIGLHALLSELDEAARREDQCEHKEPIFVTHNGLILAGFGRWRVAVLRQIATIECVEYSLTDENALQFMLSLQRRHNGWNSFIRIRLALRLEQSLHQSALNNMQLGGKYKGSANLPKAAQIHVREQIASIAGVGGRNVSKVKEILEKGHPRIISELVKGSVSINRAHSLCRLPLRSQIEALTEEYCGHAIAEVENELFIQTGNDVSTLDPAAVLNNLQHQEQQQSGSVLVQLSRRKRTVILVGQDLQRLMEKNVISSQL
jgi:hypothetical protein